MELRINGLKRDGIHDLVRVNNEPYGKFAPIGGQFDETFTTLSEDQCAAIRLTNKRAAHINLRNSSGIEIGTVTNPLNQLVAIESPNFEVKSKLLGTALTASYQTLLNTSNKLRIAYFFNSCNQTILISMASGIDHFELEPGESFMTDWATNGLYISGNIQVKHAGAAPASGSIRLSGIYHSGE